jgi:opacity protein-like surface antigen
VLALACTAWALAPPAVRGQEREEAEGSPLSVTAYAWASGFDGEVRAATSAGVVDKEFPGLGDRIDGSLLVRTDVGLGRFFVSTDLSGTWLGDSLAAPAGPGTLRAEAELYRVELTVGFDLVAIPKLRAGGYVGAEYSHLNTELRLETPGLPAEVTSGNSGWVDPVIGGRAELELSPVLVLGARTSYAGFQEEERSSTKAEAEVDFRLGRSLALVVGYRYHDVEWAASDAGIDLSIHGAMIGLRFGQR